MQTGHFLHVLQLGASQGIDVELVVASRDFVDSDAFAFLLNAKRKVVLAKPRPRDRRRAAYAHSSSLPDPPRPFMNWVH
jgi:hypothetical protein